MVKSQEEKSTSTKPTEETPEVTKTSTGKVYNFTRHNFKVVAESRKEAEEALEKHLKEGKK